MSVGILSKEEKRLSHHITKLKNKMVKLREEYLFLDIQVNAFESKLEEMVFFRTNKVYLSGKKKLRRKKESDCL